METGTWITLGLYFALMLGIGLYSYRESTSDVSGYMLGGRKLGPAVASLSAGASDMSGWLLDRHRPVPRRPGQLSDRRPAPAHLYGDGQ